jgi:hypothetical protein
MALSEEPITRGTCLIACGFHFWTLIERQHELIHTTEGHPSISCTSIRILACLKPQAQYRIH